MATTGSPMHEHFSGVAESYNELRTTDLEPILFVKDAIGGDRDVDAIDVACGGGRYSLLLCQHLPRMRLTLNDVNESMLSEAARYLTDHGIRNFTTVAADIAHLDLPDGGLDAIFTFNAIHHFDPQLLIGKAANGLGEGGQLFIYTRLRSQNAASIWGRYFPAFAEKEDRLHRRSDVEGWTDPSGRLEPAGLHEFRYERRATLDDLLRQARGKHYSTFSLYAEAEFAEAVEAFEQRLRTHFPDPDRIEWSDANVMLVFRRRAIVRD
jgi:SAM-dependent methyltransferase